MTKKISVWVLNYLHTGNTSLEFYPRTAAHVPVTLTSPERLSVEQWRLIEKQFNNMGLVPVKRIDES